MARGVRNAVRTPAASLVAILLLPGAATFVPADPGNARFSTLVCPQPVPSVDPERPLERCNVRATAHTGPANEVDLAMDADDPDHLVLVAKAYNRTRMATCTPVGEACVITVHAATFDGGRTWSEGYLQPLVPLVQVPGVIAVGNSPDLASDPIVEIARDGSVVALTIRVSPPFSNDLVYRSADGGASFQKIASLAWGDKPWMVADPFTGNLYLVQSAAERGFFKSVDGGTTWLGPVGLPCSCHEGIAVGPRGAIYAAGIAGDGTADELLVTRSTDEGATWSEPVKIADVFLHTANLPGESSRLFRAPNIATIAASQADGGVYAVWMEQPPGIARTLCELGECAPAADIYFSRSLDFGRHWSEPVKVNDDNSPLSFQFIPTVAVSPNGHDVHVAWLDQRNDPSGLLVEVFYAHSGNRGTSFDPNLVVTDAPFLSTLSQHQSGTVFVGDYIGLQASDDRAVVAFPDTRYGRADIFIATIE